MKMRKRIYRLFPQKVDCQIKKHYTYDLPMLVRVIASITGKLDKFITDSPEKRGRKIEVKREINMEITSNSFDFVPLTPNDASTIIPEIESEGIIDFKINLKYIYLDEKYRSIPLKGDSYLLRANLNGNILILQMCHIDGMGRTKCEQLSEILNKYLE